MVRAYLEETRRGSRPWPRRPGGRRRHAGAAGPRARGQRRQPRRRGHERGLRRPRDAWRAATSERPAACTASRRRLTPRAAALTAAVPPEERTEDPGLRGHGVSATGARGRPAAARPLLRLRRRRRGGAWPSTRSCARKVSSSRYWMMPGHWTASSAAAPDVRLIDRRRLTLRVSAAVPRLPTRAGARGHAGRGPTNHLTRAARSSRSCAPGLDSGGAQLWTLAAHASSFTPTCATPCANCAVRRSCSAAPRRSPLGMHADGPARAASARSTSRLPRCSGTDLHRAAPHRARRRHPR